MNEDEKNFGSWRSIIGRFVGTVAGLFTFTTTLIIAIIHWGFATGVTYGAILALVAAISAYALAYGAWIAAVATGLAARVASHIFR